jgi:hypothetical protein
MNKAVNRFEVQVVFDDGAYLRLQSKKGGVSRYELVAEVTKFLALVSDYDARQKGKEQP